MTDDTDARFDAGLRASHAAAVHDISPTVRAQLVRRRRAALRGQTPRRARGMRYALAGFAAVCAMVLGLQLRKPILPATPAAQPTAAAPGTARPDTLLDEDPEFYAWLASGDARLVAME